MGTTMPLWSQNLQRTKPAAPVELLYWRLNVKMEWSGLQRGGKKAITACRAEDENEIYDAFCWMEKHTNTHTKKTIIFPVFHFWNHHLKPDWLIG